MPKRIMFRLLLAAVAAILSASAVSAQTDSCAVKMDVTRNNSATAITGATATAVNSSSKKVYRSSVRGGMPYFRSLPQGEYRITVVRAGYMQSANNFIVSCADEEESFGIELFRGSSAKTVRLYNRTVLRAPRVKLSEADAYFDPNTPRTGGTVVGLENDVPPPLPTPKPTPKPVPKTISGGVVNGKATNLVKPAYPAAARAVEASGTVNVQVTIDEKGNVISASAVSGHPLLRAAAVQAARASKFPPTLLSGQPVKVAGVIVYNFVP